MDDDAPAVVRDAVGMTTMRRIDRRWLRGVAVLAIATVITGCGEPPPTQSGLPADSASSTPSPSGMAVSTPAASGDGLPTAASTPDASHSPSSAVTLIISEVLVDPLPGGSAFVEIANATTVAADLSGITLRVGGRDLALADPGSSLVAGGRLLVQTDGAGIALDRRSGSAEVLDPAGALIDRVAWGSSPDAVEMGPGGLVPDAVPRGSSIGRAPGADRPSERLEWVVYPATEVTPGVVNPLPRVEILLPMDGALLDVEDMTLA